MIPCDLCDQWYHDRWDGITKGVKWWLSRGGETRLLKQRPDSFSE